ncbi:MAG: hypothetical protein ABFC62_06640 [Clostridiaceae bacterium]|nr:hypothetical protein [Eubacteriales bacterium]
MEKKQPWLKPLHMLAQAMKKNKKLELIVYAGILAAAALLYVSTLGAGHEAKLDAPTAAQGSETVTEGERQVEKRLEEILSCIRGAGAVRVMVTYDTTEQIVPAMSVDTQSSTTETVNGSGQTVGQTQSESKTPVTVGGGDGALVLTEKQPEIRGVVVVAEGAADIFVRLNLQSAVQTVLGIGKENISVYEMKAADRSE